MMTTYFGQDKRLTKSEERILARWLKAPVGEHESIGESQASICDRRCGIDNRYHYVVVTIPKSKWASAPTWGEVILATVRDIMSQTLGFASLKSVDFDDRWMRIDFVADEAFGGLNPYDFEDQPSCVIKHMIEAVASEA